MKMKIVPSNTIWCGYGLQRGTLENVYASGNTEQEVRDKLSSMSYPVEIVMVWRNTSE